MKIKDIYSKRFATIHPDATFHEALKTSLRYKTNGIFVVDNQNKLLGLVSTVDLIKAIIPPYLSDNNGLAVFSSSYLFDELCHKAKNKKVKSLMMKDIPKISPEMHILFVAANTLQPEYTRLPVVDNEGHLLGVVSRTQIRQAIGKSFGLKVD